MATSSAATAAACVAAVALSAARSDDKRDWLHALRDALAAAGDDGNGGNGSGAAASIQFEVVFETRPLRLGFRPEPRGLVVIDCSQRPDLALQNGDVITALNGSPTFGWASDSVPSHIAAMKLPITAAVSGAASRGGRT